MAFSKETLAATTLLFLPVLAVSAQVITTQTQTETTTVTTETAADGTQMHYVTKQTMVEADPLVVVTVPHQTTSLRDYAGTQTSLSKFAQLMTAANLNVDLTGPEAFTVFMPTNNAFNGLLPAQRNWLAKPAEYRKELAAMLNYHAVAGRITPADLSARLAAGNGYTTLTTLEGNPLYFAQTANGIMVTDVRGQSSYIAAEPNLPTTFPSQLYRVGALFVPI